MSPEKERFQIYINVDIANKIREAAMTKDVSVTQFIVDVLKKELKIK